MHQHDVPRGTPELELRIEAMSLDEESAAALRTAERWARMDRPAGTVIPFDRPQILQPRKRVHMDL